MEHSLLIYCHTIPLFTSNKLMHITEGNMRSSILFALRDKRSQNDLLVIVVFWVWVKDKSSRRQYRLPFFLSSLILLVINIIYYLYVQNPAFLHLYMKNFSRSWISTLWRRPEMRNFVHTTWEWQKNKASNAAKHHHFWWSSQIFCTISPKNLV